MSSPGAGGEERPWTNDELNDPALKGPAQDQARARPPTLPPPPEEAAASRRFHWSRQQSSHDEEFSTPPEPPPFHNITEEVKKCKTISEGLFDTNNIMVYMNYLLTNELITPITILTGEHLSKNEDPFKLESDNIPEKHDCEKHFLTGELLKKYENPDTNTNVASKLELLYNFKLKQINKCKIIRVVNDEKIEELISEDNPEKSMIDCLDLLNQLQSKNEITSLISLQKKIIKEQVYSTLERYDKDLKQAIHDYRSERNDSLTEMKTKLYEIQDRLKEKENERFEILRKIWFTENQPSLAEKYAENIHENWKPPKNPMIRIDIKKRNDEETKELAAQILAEYKEIDCYGDVGEPKMCTDIQRFITDPYQRWETKNNPDIDLLESTRSKIIELNNYINITNKEISAWKLQIIKKEEELKENYGKNLLKDVVGTLKSIDLNESYINDAAVRELLKLIFIKEEETQRTEENAREEEGERKVQIQKLFEKYFDQDYLSPELESEYNELTKVISILKLITLTKNYLKESNREECKSKYTMSVRKKIRLYSVKRQIYNYIDILRTNLYDKIPLQRNAGGELTPKSKNVINSLNNLIDFLKSIDGFKPILDLSEKELVEQFEYEFNTTVQESADINEYISKRLNEYPKNKWIQGEGVGWVKIKPFDALQTLETLEREETGFDSNVEDEIKKDSIDLSYRRFLFLNKEAFVVDILDKNWLSRFIKIYFTKLFKEPSNCIPDVFINEIRPASISVIEHMDSVQELFSQLYLEFNKKEQQINNIYKQVLVLKDVSPNLFPITIGKNILNNFYDPLIVFLNIFWNLYDESFKQIINDIFKLIKEFLVGVPSLIKTALIRTFEYMEPYLDQFINAVNIDKLSSAKNYFKEQLMETEENKNLDIAVALVPFRDDVELELSWENAWKKIIDYMISKYSEFNGPLRNSIINSIMLSLREINVDISTTSNTLDNLSHSALNLLNPNSETLFEYSADTKMIDVFCERALIFKCSGINYNMELFSAYNSRLSITYSAFNNVKQELLFIISKYTRDKDAKNAIAGGVTILAKFFNANCVDDVVIRQNEKSWSRFIINKVSKNVPMLSFIDVLAVTDKEMLQEIDLFFRNIKSFIDGDSTIKIILKPGPKVITKEIEKVLTDKQKLWVDPNENREIMAPELSNKIDLEYAGIGGNSVYKSNSKNLNKKTKKYVFQHRNLNKHTRKMNYKQYGGFNNVVPESITNNRKCRLIPEEPDLNIMPKNIDGEAVSTKKEYNLRYETADLFNNNAQAIDNINEQIKLQNNYDWEKRMVLTKAKPKNESFAPLARQELAIHRFNQYYDKDCKGILLMHSVGSGKTLTSLAMALNTFVEGKVPYKLVIVAPSGVYKNFVDDAKESIPGATVESEDPNYKQQGFTSGNKFKYNGKIVNFYGIKYSELAPLYDKKKFDDIKLLFKDAVVIFDEAHRLLRPTSDVAFTALQLFTTRQLLSSCIKFIAMTGTPYKDTAIDIIDMMRFVEYAGSSSGSSYDSKFFPSNYYPEIKSDIITKAFAEKNKSLNEVNTKIQEKMNELNEMNETPSPDKLQTLTDELAELENEKTEINKKYENVKVKTGLNLNQSAELIEIFGIYSILAVMCIGNIVPDFVSNPALNAIQFINVLITKMKQDKSKNVIKKLFKHLFNALKLDIDNIEKLSGELEETFQGEEGEEGGEEGEGDASSEPPRVIVEYKIVCPTKIRAIVDYNKLFEILTWLFSSVFEKSTVEWFFAVTRFIFCRSEFIEHLNANTANIVEFITYVVESNDVHSLLFNVIDLSKIKQIKTKDDAINFAYGILTNLNCLNGSLASFNNYLKKNLTVEAVSKRLYSSIAVLLGYASIKINKDLGVDEPRFVEIMSNHLTKVQEMLNPPRIRQLTLEENLDYLQDVKLKPIYSYLTSNGELPGEYSKENVSKFIENTNSRLTKQQIADINEYRVIIKTRIAKTTTRILDKCNSEIKTIGAAFEKDFSDELNKKFNNDEYLVDELTNATIDWAQINSASSHLFGKQTNDLIAQQVKDKIKEMKGKFKQVSKSVLVLAKEQITTVLQETEDYVRQTIKKIIGDSFHEKHLQSPIYEITVLIDPQNIDLLSSDKEYFNKLESALTKLSSFEGGTIIDKIISDVQNVIDGETLNKITECIDDAIHKKTWLGKTYESWRNYFIRPSGLGGLFYTYAMNIPKTASIYDYEKITSDIKEYVSYIDVSMKNIDPMFSGESMTITDNGSKKTLHLPGFSYSNFDITKELIKIEENRKTHVYPYKDVNVVYIKYNDEQRIFAGKIQQRVLNSNAWYMQYCKNLNNPRDGMIRGIGNYSEDFEIATSEFDLRSTFYSRYKLKSPYSRESGDEYKQFIEKTPKFECLKFQRVLQYLLIMKMGKMISSSGLIDQPHLTTRTNDNYGTNDYDHNKTPGFIKKITYNEATHYFLPLVFSCTEIIGINLFASYLESYGLKCITFHSESKGEVLDAEKYRGINKTYHILKKKQELESYKKTLESKLENLNISQSVSSINCTEEELDKAETEEDLANCSGNQLADQPVNGAYKSNILKYPATQPIQDRELKRLKAGYNIEIAEIDKIINNINASQQETGIEEYFLSNGDKVLNEGTESEPKIANALINGVLSDNLIENRKLILSLINDYKSITNDPICILIHPDMTEGIDCKHNPAIFLLEPPNTYGDLDQLCGRVLRTYKNPGYKEQPIKTVYQFVCYNEAQINKVYDDRYKTISANPDLSVFYNQESGTVLKDLYEKAKDTGIKLPEQVELVIGLEGKEVNEEIKTEIKKKLKRYINSINAKVTTTPFDYILKLFYGFIFGSAESNPAEEISLDNIYLFLNSFFSNEAKSHRNALLELNKIYRSAKWSNLITPIDIFLGNVNYKLASLLDYDQTLINRANIYRENEKKLFSENGLAKNLRKEAESQYNLMMSRGFYYGENLKMPTTLLETGIMEINTNMLDSQSPDIERLISLKLSENEVSMLKTKLASCEEGVDKLPYDLKQIETFIDTKFPEQKDDYKIIPWCRTFHGEDYVNGKLITNLDNCFYCNNTNNHVQEIIINKKDDKRAEYDDVKATYIRELTAIYNGLTNANREESYNRAIGITNALHKIINGTNGESYITIVKEGGVLTTKCENKENGPKPVIDTQIKPVQTRATTAAAAAAAVRSGGNKTKRNRQKVSIRKKSNYSINERLYSKKKIKNKTKRR